MAHRRHRITYFRRLLPRTIQPCDRCALKPACFGVRHVDVQSFGDACVMPFEVEPS